MFFFKMFFLFLLFFINYFILIFKKNKKNQKIKKNFAIRHSENFTNIAKFLLCQIFATIAKFRYGSEIFAMLYCFVS